LGYLTEAAICFERCDDVPKGGVLCALPVLLAVGLLRHVRQCFTWPKGYYPLETIFLSLAYLALGRVHSLEALRYQPPGEWGRLLGLDRIPEVKTMRRKIAVLCQQPEPTASWSGQLAQDWMKMANEHTGFYYVYGWQNGECVCPMITGSERCATATSEVTRQRFSPPIMFTRWRRWLRPSLLAGVRKTSSGTCSNTIR